MNNWLVTNYIFLKSVLERFFSYEIPNVENGNLYTILLQNNWNKYPIKLNAFLL